MGRATLWTYLRRCYLRSREDEWLTSSVEAVLISLAMAVLLKLKIRVKTESRSWDDP